MYFLNEIKVLQIEGCAQSILSKIFSFEKLHWFKETLALRGIKTKQTAEQ
jgi:hypothetical protein